MGEARSTLGKNNTILILAETYFTTEIAPIEPERRHRLVPEMHPAHARTATRDFHGREMTGQQYLFHRLALVGHSVEQDVVTGEQGLLATGALQPNARRQTVCISMFTDVTQRIAEGLRVFHDQSQRSKHPAALTLRQAHAEIGASQFCRSKLDKMDHLPIGGVRMPSEKFSASRPTRIIKSFGLPPSSSTRSGKKRRNRACTRSKTSAVANSCCANKG